jgi:hypothetical protein
MAPEGLLPCSQELAIWPFPEAGEYNPHAPILFP